MSDKPGRVGNTSAANQPGGYQNHYASLFMHGPLYKIAKKLPPNPKVIQKKAEPKKIYQPHISDEDALAMILEIKKGMRRKLAAEKYGCSMATVNNLMTGVNRGHLLRQVEEGYESHRLAKR